MSGKEFSGDKLKEIFEKKKARLYLECKRLAQEAVQEMQKEQLGNKYWDNETYQAVETLFGDAFMEEDAIGFFLAHEKDYGVFLELANDRKHAILLPTAEIYALKAKLAAQEIFGGGS